MIIIAGSYIFPDKCPKNCLYKQESFSQGSMCTRCPILNCKKDKDGFCLIEPEDYRKDWAKEWNDFFKRGTEPKLYL